MIPVGMVAKHKIERVKVKKGSRSPPSGKESVGIKNPKGSYRNKRYGGGRVS